MRNVAIVRLEQIAPFPFDRVASVINRYPNAQLTWIQVWAMSFHFSFLYSNPLSHDASKILVVFYLPRHFSVQI